MAARWLAQAITCLAPPQSIEQTNHKISLRASRRTPVLSTYMIHLDIITLDKLTLDKLTLDKGVGCG